MLQVYFEYKGHRYGTDAREYWHRVADKAEARAYLQAVRKRAIASNTIITYVEVRDLATNEVVWAWGADA